MDDLNILKQMYDHRDLDNGGTDFVIHCGDQVHKVVMRFASPFFNVACYGSFKENNEGILKFPEDDPKAVEAMIRFIYLGTFADDTCFSKEERSCKNDHKSGCPALLDLYATLCSLGEKYDITSLRRVATGYFRDTLSSSLPIPYELFCLAIEIVYGNDSELNTGLRVCITRFYSNRGIDVESDDDRFRELLKAIPELGHDVAVHLWEMFKEKRQKGNQWRGDMCL